MNRRKLQEVAYVEGARSLRPDLFPMGHRQDGDGERPDIVVYGDGWTYGVEVTGFVTQSEKLQEQVRRDVCGIAQRMAALPPGFRVSVLFRREYVIRDRKEQEAMATALVALVSGEVQSRPQDASWGVELKLWGSEMWTWATQVFIHFYPWDQVSEWRSQEGWGVGPLLPERIRDRIAAKESLLPTYRLRAPRITLLLVIAGLAGSESHYIPEVTRQAAFTTDFDEVIVYDQVNAEVLQLNLVR